MPESERRKFVSKGGRLTRGETLALFDRIEELEEAIRAHREVAYRPRAFLEERTGPDRKLWATLDRPLPKDDHEQ